MVSNSSVVSTEIKTSERGGYLGCLMASSEHSRQLPSQAQKCDVYRQNVGADFPAQSNNMHK